MKKVLIISYYWPPSAGGGVFRWLKMTKYFPENDWKPIVYTPLDGEPSALDETLLAEIHPEVEVIKEPIWEPYQLYKIFTGRKKNEKIYSGFISEKKKPGLMQQISVFIRGNFFIPDARKYWIKPSIKFLVDYLSKHKVDAIISTGPPHSMHMIALGVKQKFASIPWVADFRDPWTKIDFYEHLKLTKWADKKHRRLEQRVLSAADKIVTVSWAWSRDFEVLSKRKDIEVIPNGFDPEDFKNDHALRDEFTICHLGSMNPDRNPVALWRALKTIVSIDGEFRSKLRIQLVGKVDGSILSSIREYGLENYLEVIGQTSHREAIRMLSESKIALLPINKTANSRGVLPGKLYEYLAVGRPILAIGPGDGDVSLILDKTRAGKLFEYEDVEGIADFLVNADAFPVDQKVDAEIARFSRKSLAQQYTVLLNRIIEK